ncbi:MAG: Ig-like domain-containing protein [Muribaculaceae bacterium]|nr:Ig-like domain-containing protein [Muribaculaceae bacterium]
MMAQFQDESSGYFFSLSEENGNAIITGLLDELCQGQLSIPETVTFEENTYVVTAVGDNAFSGKMAVTGVTFPASVNSIGASAFYGCVNLSSIITEGELTEVGEDAFGGTSVTAFTSVLFGIRGGNGDKIVDPVIAPGGSGDDDPAVNPFSVLDLRDNVVMPGVGNTSGLTSLWDGSSRDSDPSNELEDSEVANFYDRALPPDSVVIEIHELPIANGDSCRLTAKVYPLDVYGGVPVRWISSDKRIAFVECGGRVVSKGNGMCNIIANYNGKSDTCVVSVIDPSHVVISLDQHYANVCLNNDFNLTPTLNTVGTSIKAISSNPEIASASLENGKVVVHAQGIGLTSIVVQSQDEKALADTCDVKVYSFVGDGDGDGAVGISDVTSLIDYLLSGNSDIDPNFADVDGDGAGPNISDVTSLIDGLLSNADPTILITPDAIILSLEDVKLEKGKKSVLLAELIPEEASTTINWCSSDPSVATFDNKYINAVSAGECDIIAECYGVRAICHVSVYEPEIVLPESVTLDKTEASLEVGAEMTLVATVQPENVTNPTLTWSSSNPAVATVTNNGLVKAVAPGDCDITVKCQDVQAVCHVQVYEITPESLTLNQTEATLEVGGQMTLVATVQPANVTNPTLTWSSSNPAVATVTNNGLVKAVAPGDCDITVKCQDVQAVCHVHVNEITPESVTLNKTEATLEVGGQMTLVATVQPANVTNPTLTWSSSNTTVATVTNNGLVKAVAPGDCDITVKCQDVQAVCHVHVNTSDVTIDSVALNITADSLAVGSQMTLIATVYPATVTNPTLKWTSSSTSIATVTSAGVVKAVSVGECDITVKCLDKQAVCHITTYEVLPDSVTLNHYKIRLSPGDTTTLIATVFPENTSKKTITWYSTKGSVATVKKGLVTAVGEGECDIVAKCQDKSARCHVVVNNNMIITVNGVTFEMVQVEGGTFMMGSDPYQAGSKVFEKPQHQVTVSSYMIGQTEVTQELWNAIMPPDVTVTWFPGDPQRPMDNVTWENCQTFISKLNELTGMNFRLPTEAEWEFAAHGGKKSKHYKFSGSDTLSDVAWYYDNSGCYGVGDPEYGPHPVATKMPNELGIYDMSGNVWEWCNDWYSAYTEDPQVDPTGPETGNYKVYRCGCWNDSLVDCRITYRYMQPVTYRSKYIGFRLAL